MKSKKLFYGAVAGWGAAVLVHGVALAGVDIATFAPAVWVLHVGLLALWFSAGFSLRRAPALQPRRISLAEVVTHIPRWLAVVAVAGMAYAPANYLLFSPLQSTGQADGQYYTHIHGQDHHPITEREYHRARANVLRAFSGGWIGFYGMAMACLYPFKKPERPEEQEGV